MKIFDLDEDELIILFLLLKNNSYLHSSYIGKIILDTIYSYKLKRVFSKEHREKLSSWQRE